jgi:hypothetical protein
MRLLAKRSNYILIVEQAVHSTNTMYVTGCLIGRPSGRPTVVETAAGMVVSCLRLSPTTAHQCFQATPYTRHPPQRPTLPAPKTHCPHLDVEDCIQRHPLSISLHRCAQRPRWMVDLDADRRASESPPQTPNCERTVAALGESLPAPAPKGTAGLQALPSSTSSHTQQQ